MHKLDLKIRLHCGDDIAIGPGKADLLSVIERVGLIIGAARCLVGSGTDGERLKVCPRI